MHSFKGVGTSDEVIPKITLCQLRCDQNSAKCKRSVLTIQSFVDIGGTNQKLFHKSEAPNQPNDEEIEFHHNFM
jgi:hypothetical protein